MSKSEWCRWVASSLWHLVRYSPGKAWYLWRNDLMFAKDAIRTAWSVAWWRIEDRWED